MDVLRITMLVSLCLASVFALAFYFEWRRRSRTGAGREPLLPFDDAEEGVRENQEEAETDSPTTHL